MAIAKDKLPHNIDAEKAFLGTMIVSADAKDTGLTIVHPTDFFIKSHELIYQAIYNLNRRSEKVDLQTVAEELKNMKVLDDIGGVDYLYELTQSFISVENVEEYANIVRSNGNCRDLFKVMADIEKEYITKKIDSFSEFVAEAQSRINKVAEERSISNFVPSYLEMDEIRNKIYEISKSRREDELTGLDTGFRDLNKITNGLQKENLIIVAGRTATGKTAFALNLLLNCAIKNQKPVAIFEMEMSSFLLYTRLIASKSFISSRKIQNGWISDKEKLPMNETINLIKNSKIYMDASPHLTMLDLCAKARKLKKEQPDLSLIVVDHLGLISSDETNKRRNESRQLEIQEYTRTLKELARELQVALVLVCQLSRKTEDRGEGSTPKLVDLRESGSIEQDADIVLLLHRENYGKNALSIKKSKTKAADMSAEDRKKLMDHIQEKALNENKGKNEAESTIMHVIIGKNRNGQSDTVVDLVYFMDYSAFQDMSEELKKQRQEIDKKYLEDINNT